MGAGQEFYVMIEKDEDGFHVGEVPQLRGCYSQGKSLDELMKNIKEVIQLCLEDGNSNVLSERRLTHSLRIRLLLKGCSEGIQAPLLLPHAETIRHLIKGTY